MCKLKIFYTALLFFFIPNMVQAAIQRDLIIQKTLDCMDEHPQNGNGIGWNDVCEMSDTTSKQSSDSVDEQINQMNEDLSKPIAITSQDTKGELQATPKKAKWDSAISPEISFITYREPGLIKEKGAMYGINTSYTYRPQGDDYIDPDFMDYYRLEGMFSYGKMDYHGGIESAANGITPEKFNGIKDYMVEPRLLSGKDFYFKNQSTLLTPYVGAGYRYLFDSSYENKPYGYNRQIQYFYIPVGVDTTTQFGNDWSIGANVEYDIFIYGFVDSYLGEIGFVNIQNAQNKGYGLRGSLKLTKKGGRFNIFLEPYVRFWSVQQSKPYYPFGESFGLYYVEPNNSSLEIGGKLGIEF